MEVHFALVLSAVPVEPSDLAGWLEIELSTMSRNLTLMEQKGLVATSEISPTGRSLRVTITATGSETLAHAEQAWNTSQQALRTVLGDDAIPILDTWLSRLETPNSSD